MPSPTLPNGVSAGDVTQDRAVLWTRSTVEGPLNFSVSTTPNFLTLVTETVTSVDDPTQPVKVRIDDLAPGTTYYYRATNAAGESETGQFETASPTGTQAGLHFGVSGDWRGDMAPYPSIANADEQGLDFFVKLGDSIYADYPSTAVPEPQAVTLAQYRAKHAEGYATTLDLNTWADLQRSTAVLSVIDDHEVTNDWAGGASPNTDPRFADSSAQFINDTLLYETGLQAFNEYNAIRDEIYSGTGDPRFEGEVNFYRHNTYGDDAAVFVVDARSFRDAALARVDPTDPLDILRFLNQTYEPGRTLLGETQLEQLKQDLVSAEAGGITWKFVMLPEPIQNLTIGNAEDRYEGYAAERTELLRFINENNIDNVVFVSADLHGTFVNNLTYQERFGGPQIPTTAFEIVTGPVAANSLGPQVVDQTIAAGLLPSEVRAFYDQLPVRPDPGNFITDKDDFVKAIFNTQDELLGYDRLGLDDNLSTADGLIDATLLTGDYVNVHNYGWSEFTIDEQTQQLRVTTWGIETYTPEELRAEPQDIVSRTPEVVSEFIVNPRFDDTVGNGTVSDGTDSVGDNSDGISLDLADLLGQTINSRQWFEASSGFLNDLW
jgi:alkaline phosphatase D